MSDITNDAAARRSNHITPEGGEIVPPPVRPRPPLPADGDHPSLSEDAEGGEHRSLSEDAERGEHRSLSEDARSATETKRRNLADDDGSPHPSTPRRRLGVAGIAAIAAAVIAAVGWVAFGVTLSNLTTTSDDLAAAQESATGYKSELDDKTVELRTVEGERNTLQDAADGVAEREAAATTREAELDAREAAIKEAEDYKQATTLLDGYTYTVGLTMEAGTYRTNSENDRCYWAIYRSGSNQSDIVDNDLGAMGAITVKISKGQDFESTRCGDWTKVG